jgi:hypothetical protein
MVLARPDTTRSPNAQSTSVSRAPDALVACVPPACHPLVRRSVVALTVRGVTIADEILATTAPPEVGGHATVPTR